MTRERERLSRVNPELRRRWAKADEYATRALTATDDATRRAAEAAYGQARDEAERYGNSL